jgi:hypothetical protein
VCGNFNHSNEVSNNKINLNVFKLHIMIFNRKPIRQGAKNSIFLMPFVFLTTSFLECNPDDPLTLADEICECVADANGNLVTIAQCYNHAQQMRKEELTSVEDKKKFDEAILTCFGAGLVEDIQKFLIKK